jgi:hypothetical protein
MGPSTDLAKELLALEAHRSRGEKRATAMHCGVLLERLLKVRALAVLTSGSGAERDALQAALGATPVDRATLGDLLRGLASDALVGKRKQAFWKVRDARNWAAHDGSDEPNALTIEGCAEAIWELVADLGLPEAGLARAPLTASIAPSRAGWHAPAVFVAVAVVAALVGLGVYTRPTSSDRAVLTAPEPPPAAARPAPLLVEPDPGPMALAVMLYADADAGGPPAADDLSARRRFLAEQVIPALVRARPRAIALDFHFVGGADEEASRALVRALGDARDANVPVLAVLPVGRRSELPICREGVDGACALALADARVPAGDVRSWSTCGGDRMTFGLAVARLVDTLGMPTSTWRDDFVCEPDPVPLVLPAGGPCSWPWKRLWVSELLTGARYEGPDPVTLRADASCGATAADLAGRVVIVGDPRMSSEGKDVVRLGDARGGELVPFAGTEAHAVVAWNLVGRLPSSDWPRSR